MANITRIKAQDPHAKKPKAPEADQPKPTGDQPAAEADQVVEVEAVETEKVLIEPVDDGPTAAEEMADVEAALSLTAAEKKEVQAEEKAVKKLEKAAKKADKKAKKAEKKATKKPNYFKASWQELRQVRWPNRAATWKMVLAVVVYAGIFMAFITLLDVLFSFIFNNILGA